MSDYNLVLVVVYLIITLSVGIFTGRNVKNLKEYTLGRRDFSPVILAMTVCATLIGGGSSLGTATEVFKFGIIVMFAKFGVSIGSLIIAFCIVPRMKKFIGMITVGEVIGSIYGKNARIITGISGALLCISRMASQLMALGFVFNLSLGVSNEIGVLIGVLVIVIYSSYGGIRSVAYTDVLQFVVLAVTVPIVLNLGIKQVGGYAQLFHILPSDKIDIFYDNKMYIKYLIVFLYMSLPLLSPPFVQRILMSKNLEDAKKSFIAMAVVDFVFTTISGLIGLVAYALYPTLSPNIAYLGLINNLLPEGLKGLALIGIISVVMSTADSYLNVVGVSIAHDVLKPLKIKLSTKDELSFVRAFTFAAGIFATIIALYFDNIFELALYTTNFWGPVVVGPLLVGIFGFRTTQLPFLIGACSGVGAFLMWELFSLREITYVYSVVPAIVGNIVGFFSAHYLFRQPGGWDKIHHQADTKRKSQFSISLKKLYYYLESNIKSVPIPYNVFSIFVIISYVFPSIIWEECQGTDVIYIKSFVGLMAVVMLLKDIFGNVYQKYESILWFCILVVSLPFTSIIILYDSGLSSGGLLVLTLSILLLSFLVTSEIFVLVLITGVLVSIPYLYLAEKKVAYTIVDMAWILYVLAFTIAIALLFIRNRENNAKKQILAAQSIAGVVAHELKNPLAELDARLYAFAANLSDYQSKKLEEDFKSIQQVGLNLKQTLDIILVKLRGGNFSNVEMKEYDAVDLVQDCIKKYQIMSSVSGEKIEVTSKKNSLLFCDAELIKHVLFNVINNALYYNNKREQPVEIIIDQIDNTFVIIIRDYGKGVSVDKCNLIFHSFFTDKKNGTGLGLYFCKQAMLKMNGDIVCESVEGEKTDFIISLPVI